MEAGNASERWWMPPVCGLLLALAGAAVYANSLDGPFVFDDRDAILDNPHIESLWGFLDAPSGRHTGVSRRPVIGFSLSVNHALGGLEVRGYHLTNVAVHVLAALLLFGVARRSLLGERRAPRHRAAALPLAFFCALLWAVHPLHTASVSYVVQRAESIMGLFFLLSLYAVIRSKQAARPLVWQGLAVGACALGMGSKEVMATAPPLIFLHQVAFESGSFREEWRRHTGLYVGLAGTELILVWLLLDAPYAGSVGLSLGTSPLEYLLAQCVHVVHYLRLSVWPDPLSIDYGPYRPVGWSEALPGALLLTAALAASLAAWRRSPPLSFLGVSFFVLLAPTSSLLPIETEVAAEWRMYLPLACLVALAVVGVYEGAWRGSRRFALGRGLFPVAVGVAASLAVALGWTTLRRNQDFRNDVSLWRSAVEVVPGNPRAWNNLGLAHFRSGRVEEAGRQYRTALELDSDYATAHNNLGQVLYEQGDLAGAEHHYRRATALEEDYADPHNNLGVVLEAQGRVAEATEAYRQALQRKPVYPGALYNLGAALHSRGEVAAAVHHYRKVLELEPGHPDAHNNLGVALQSEGRLDEAVAHFRSSLEARPDFAEGHYNLARALQTRGDVDGAIHHYRRAAESKPESGFAQVELGVLLQRSGQIEQAAHHYRQAIRFDPDSPTAYAYLAQLLVSRPEPDPDEVAKALGLAEVAARLTHRGDPRILTVLAQIYALAGRLEEAITVGEQALELAEASGDAELARALGGRLDAFRARRAAATSR